MFDTAAALALLQMGDSAYPAGGFAFSWGIEGLLADGWIRDADDLDETIEDHLRLRWSTMDRVLLCRAFAAATRDAVAEIDRLADAATLSAQMRQGSQRAGKALLGVAVRLQGPLSVAYRERVSADPRLGHLPVIQALAFRDAGLDRAAAELLSGWTLVTGLVSAAVRLGSIGHIEAQQALAASRPVLAELLSAPAPDDISSFTPLIDIAVSRGPSRHVRMFST